MPTPHSSAYVADGLKHHLGHWPSCGQLVVKGDCLFGIKCGLQILATLFMDPAFEASERRHVGDSSPGCRISQVSDLCFAVIGVAFWLPCKLF